MADDLSHFRDAQDSVWADVTAELAAGRKRTHWMWFVFPQIEGLGSSPMAQRYALRDLGHARRYLADPLLGERLRDGVRLALSHRDRSANAVFGSPDDLKFRSCLTLFRKAASDAADQALFGEALAAFYGGAPDPRTLELLG
ncbi:MAG: DUF1810 family protein [Alphaproteobacteria bacterium]|nr:DUF1810 family protein [Alphaproteobacteria bacterium]